MTEQPLRQRTPLQVALILTAVAVWGGVAYRIGSTLPGGADATALPPPTHAVPLPDASRPAVVTTIEVSRDPFRPQWPGTTEPQTTGPGAPPSEPSPAPPPREPPSPPTLALTGVIGDTAILEAPDGTIHLVRTGDRIGEIEVAGVSTDLVDLVSGSHRFTLSLNP